jgi:hypothetical protein
VVMGHSNCKDGQTVINKTNLNKTGQATYYKVTLMCTGATIVAVGKLYVIHILSVCL